MKLFNSVLAFCLASVSGVFGQVTVEVESDQKHYLAHERLEVRVKITNFSGQTIHLGQGDEWLTFMVEGQNGAPVMTFDDVPVAGEFRLENATVGTKRVDIAPYYNLTRPGRYKVTAIVRVPQLGEQIISPPKNFDIMSGAKIWELDFGVPPDAADPEETPEVRKYALLQAIHTKELMLYFRLSNRAETAIYRVYPIGRMVSFSRPEPQLDRQSRLHILYQDGARSFQYFVINTEGLIEVRQTHHYTTSKPALRPDREGNIRVMGGARKFTNRDLPRQASAPPSLNEVLGEP
jgi:hypothetical protein